jgi:hypothetical protein
MHHRKHMSCHHYAASPLLPAAWTYSKHISRDHYLLLCDGTADTENSFRYCCMLDCVYIYVTSQCIDQIRYTYIDEITGNHQCGFQRNRSTTDQLFCIRQILEKKWEYNETVHQLFIESKIFFFNFASCCVSITHNTDSTNSATIIY